MRTGMVLATSGSALLLVVGALTLLVTSSQSEGCTACFARGWSSLAAGAGGIAAVLMSRRDPRRSGVALVLLGAAIGIIGPMFLDGPLLVVPSAITSAGGLALAAAARSDRSPSP